MRSYRLGEGPESSMTGVFIKLKGEIWTETRAHGENTVWTRRQRSSCRVHEPQSVPDCRPAPGAGGQRLGADSPSQPSEGTNPDEALISDFWPPERSARQNISVLRHRHGCFVRAALAHTDDEKAEVSVASFP